MTVPLPAIGFENILCLFAEKTHVFKRRLECKIGKVLGLSTKNGEDRHLIRPFVDFKLFSLLRPANLADYAVIRFSYKAHKHVYISLFFFLIFWHVLSYIGGTRVCLL